MNHSKISEYKKMEEQDEAEIVDETPACSRKAHRGRELNEADNLKY